MSLPPPPNGPHYDEDSPYHVSQASRIYFLPNLMTAGNIFCGFGAIIRCVQANFAAKMSDGSVLPPEAIEFYKHAVWLIFGAMAFDMLDGRLARMGGKESLFGAEFDSLADVVSFGLAPALMMFFLIMSPSQGYPIFQNIGWLIGFIYLLCAAIRLARFNVITHPLLQRSEVYSNKDFIGLPVPAAAGTVGALVLFLLHLAAQDKSLHRWAAFSLPFLLLLIAILMVSTVRYPSGKQIDLQTRTPLITFLLFGMVTAAVIMFKEIGMLVCCLGYIFFGFGRHIQRTRKARRMRRQMSQKTL
ncbi:CDP-diacylglycerol--serine O-phosphatidyltransferase [Geminisphaera colitermitum]|uniref:CDP-diacylglycerol--serine O-phosphatidyltransferase n=1 Tax=Geminisphaera colitermitum TaxID=1148786 RepID=UPI000158CCDE|nr:CDP-diacylglycerol--serine O-phosphatidyltransferase [Geminisphaera colitermitum]